MAKKGFFIDVQGTLICDEKREPILGAVEFIDILNERDIPYMVITNNTKAKSEDFLASLQNKGLNIKNYIDPFSLLQKVALKKNVAAFGTEEFLAVLLQLGYELDFENPASLIVSIKKDYHNDDYAKMIDCAYKTDDIIGMHETSTYLKEGSRYPGVGAIMSMIKFAVNKEYKVVGKPSFSYYEKARELLDMNFEDITIISDDMMGDLVGAKKFGMKAGLVLSGKVKCASEVIPTLSENEKPEFICKDMSEIVELLNRNEI